MQKKLSRKLHLQSQNLEIHRFSKSMKKSLRQNLPMQDIYSIYLNALVFFLSGCLLQRKLVPCDVNIGMCSMQELFFLAG